MYRVPPLLAAITEASSEFIKRYGVSPERIHVSRAIEKALKRFADEALAKDETNSLNDPNGAEIYGMEVVQSTKASPHAEFWLSKTQGGQVHSLHSRITPEMAGGSKLVLPGESHIG